jgi:hypothetical protein
MASGWLETPRRGHGGKSGFTSNIAALFPEHHTYCEVFDGSGAVVLQRNHRRRRFLTTSMIPWSVCSGLSAIRICASNFRRRVPAQCSRSKPMSATPVRQGILNWTRAYLYLRTSPLNHRGHHDAGIACKKSPTANPAIPLPNSTHPLIASLLNFQHPNDESSPWCAQGSHISFIGYPTQIRRDRINVRRCPRRVSVRSFRLAQSRGWA